ncbi:MAG TPA: hypothetical protein VKZ18_11090 [Polyangia bacterium]|nr:hypothetical protein [Polyangia bacterium]
MSESDDGTVEVLKEIRDELRNVRTELLAQLRDEARNARAGVRTERVARAAWISRWPLVAMSGTGAVALLALILAVRAGGPAAPAVLAPPTPVASAAPAPALAPAPKIAKIPEVAAAKPPAAKSAPRVALAAVPSPAVAVPAPVTPKKRTRPESVSPKPVAAAPGDDDETMAFSPPAPRRVRVHKMSYDSSGFEPAKL